MSFIINNMEWQHIISDSKSDYVLRITPGMCEKFELVKFQIPYTGQINSGKIFRSYLDITGRDPEEYHFPMSDLVLNVGFQYTEPGAGLGGVIEKIMSELGPKMKRPIIIDPGPKMKRPIIIDPVDYGLMRNMLSYAKEKMDLSNYMDFVSNEIITIIDKYIRRCDLYTDFSRVRLINMKLGDALEAHPELKGIGDVVIDNAMTIYYPWTESDPFVVQKDYDPYNHMYNLSRQLLKSGGVWLTSPSNSQT